MNVRQRRKEMPRQSLKPVSLPYKAAPEAFGPKIIKSPDEARAIGNGMAKEVAEKLKLRLTA